MAEDTKLNAFLAGAGLQALQDYANDLGPERLNHCPGSGVRAEFVREIDVDWDAGEIVILDTIEFRISGPEGLHPDGGGAPDRRARRAGRVRGGRARRGRNGKVVRH